MSLLQQLGQPLQLWGRSVLTAGKRPQQNHTGPRPGPGQKQTLTAAQAGLELQSAFSYALESPRGRVLSLTVTSSCVLSARSNSMTLRP